MSIGLQQRIVTLKSKMFLNTTLGGTIIGESKISAPDFSAKSNSPISEEQVLVSCLGKDGLLLSVSYNQ